LLEQEKHNMTPEQGYYLDQISAKGLHGYFSETRQRLENAFFYAAFDPLTHEYLKRPKNTFVVLVQSDKLIQGVFGCLTARHPPEDNYGTGELIIPLSQNPFINLRHMGPVRYYAGFDWMIRWNRDVIKRQRIEYSGDSPETAMKLLQDISPDLALADFEYGRTRKAFPFGLRISTPTETLPVIDSQTQTAGNSLLPDERAIISAIGLCKDMVKLKALSGIFITPQNIFDTLILREAPVKWQI
jgi:hypothetical protein